ncbi:MAG: hypothetical protein ACTSXD_02115 [Candidatus Heimdallarchaeaceae archaeon]
MIGDIVVIEEIHEQKAEIIYPKIIDKYNGNKMVVTICGVSGTGKTEIASVLQQNLFYRNGIKAKQIHIDDYYNTNFHTRNESRKESGIIGKDEINWNKLNYVIEIFRTRLPKLYVRRIHKFIDSTEYCICDNRKIDVLIVEGLYGNYLEDKDYAVYLEGNISQTSNFRKRRGKESIDIEFEQLVLSVEQEDVQSSKQHSDLIIPF